MATKPATSTTQLFENLGNGMRTFVYKTSADPWTYENEVAFGRQIDALIRAAVKSAVPGRQSNKQLTEMQQKARQAFARALARKVKAL